jgi:hypothetical protein
MSSEPTIIYYPAPEAPLTRPEVMQTLGAALDGNPKLNQALRQLIAERLAYATSECAVADLSERAAGHAGGRLAALTSLQHEFALALTGARELRSRAQGGGGLDGARERRRGRA